MKNTTHFMIDIETLSTAPDAVIVSAACVKFNPEDGQAAKELYRVIDPSSCVKVGGTINPETVKWWLCQSEDARLAIAQAECSIEDFLVELNMFIGHQAADDNMIRVWAKPPSFDCVILRGYYDRVGECDPAWSFREERDVRTLIDFAGVDARDFNRGTSHNALHDCYAQIAAVQAAYQQLRT
jgi:hypothetical protein